MPRFYFDVYGETVIRDIKGTELPDEMAAQAFADGLASTLPKPQNGGQPPRVMICRDPLSPPHSGAPSLYVSQSKDGDDDEAERIPQ